MNFLDALKNRRSVYDISKENILSNEEIYSLVDEIVEFLPSPYNSQTGRFVILTDENNQEFWQIVLNTLKGLTSEKRFPATKEKIDAFANSQGTILFFDEAEETERIADTMPKYKEKFTSWAQHSNAMAQFAIWVALETFGYGASLQHYNPIIDSEVKKSFGLPKTWSLIAQMPFGKKKSEPEELDKIPLSQRVFKM